MAPIPHCRAGKVWLVRGQVGVLPQHVSGESEHSPPPAPERLYLQMHARVHDQSEDLAEERADGTSHQASWGIFSAGSGAPTSGSASRQSASSGRLR